MNYPIMNPETIADRTTGRILFIDKAEDLTPNKFYSYINEGFMPVGRTITSGTMKFALVEFSTAIGDEETYTLKVGSNTYTSAPTEVDGVTVPAWDLPYSA